MSEAAGRVHRDAAWVEREYGREKWPAVFAEIERLVAGGETSLARAVAALSRREWGWPQREPVEILCGAQRLSLPAALAWNGCYAMIAETVIAACRPETRAIIDLGSGWGRSLFDVWLRGGPRGIPYIAAEFTRAGRDCAQRLAALDPALPFQPARFDLADPDFSFLPGRLPHAVLFSVSSLHQIPAMTPAAYRKLLSVAESADCLHFEQIGWQITGAAGEPAEVYALRHDYNRNLWQVIEVLAREGSIAICAAEPDLFGLQPDYPLSLVHWRREAGTAAT